MTCSARCRKRLSRGGALGYLRGMTPTERARERKRHYRADRKRGALKQAAIGVRLEREISRLIKAEQRRARAEAQMRQAEEREDRAIERQQAIEERARRLWLSLFLMDAIARLEMLKQNFASVAEMEAHADFVGNVLADIPAEDIAAALEPDALGEARREAAKARRAAAKAAKAAARLAAASRRKRVVARKPAVLMVAGAVIGHALRYTDVSFPRCSRFCGRAVLSSPP
jgi:hypothetical protein